MLALLSHGILRLFFSSRRRHTRLQGDWSSDVCSSDLAAQLLVLLCAAQFLFWYGFHLFANTNASIAMLQYDAWNDVNHGDPVGRIAVRDRLAQAAGKQLVVVRYWPQHRFQEWVQNAADIDKARVVWALDRGAAENEKLRHYYPDRTVWLLEPDARPPTLAP